PSGSSTVVCLAAHGSEFPGGLPQMSNCYCLPGRAGGFPIIIREKDPIRWLLYKTKTRCKKLGIPFDITSADIVQSTHCPVFGTKLNYLGTNTVDCRGGRRPDNTASLDRIVLSLGYVKGNVIVVSWRANEIKKDATCDELKAVMSFYSRFQKQ
ncbi:MAG: hypothetical protein ACREXX_17680, partial [Gammaproteobacteria bacterium]